MDDGDPGCQRAHSAVLASNEVVGFQRALETPYQRKSRKRRFMQKQGTLTVEEGAQMAASEAGGEEEGEGRPATRGRTSEGSPQPRRCSGCNQPGHTFRTCPGGTLGLGDSRGIGFICVARRGVEIIAFIQRGVEVLGWRFACKVALSYSASKSVLTLKLPDKCGLGRLLEGANGLGAEAKVLLEVHGNLTDMEPVSSDLCSNWSQVYFWPAAGSAGFWGSG